jgi:hypothetical protein
MIYFKNALPFFLREDFFIFLETLLSKQDLNVNILFVEDVDTITNDAFDKPVLVTVFVEFLLEISQHLCFSLNVHVKSEGEKFFHYVNLRVVSLNFVILIEEYKVCAAHISHQAEILLNLII